MYTTRTLGVGVTGSTLAYTGFEAFWPVVTALFAGLLAIALMRMALVDLSAGGL